MRYLQSTAGAVFGLSAATLILLWAVKDTKPSGSAVLPILCGALGTSALIWLIAEVWRRRAEQTSELTGNEKMNRLIGRQFRDLKRRRLIEGLLRHRSAPSASAPQSEAENPFRQRAIEQLQMAEQELEGRRSDPEGPQA